jgi:soluble cytochrome b562
MSISGIGGSVDPALYQQKRQQLEKDLNDLKAALQAGDTTEAQQALSALEKLKPEGSTGASSGDSTVLKVGQDIAAIGQALSSGDLSAARQNFSKLENLLSNGQSGSSSDLSGTSTANADADPLTNDFKALKNALQSGDLAGAQTAFQQLQQDLSSGPQGKTGGDSTSGDGTASQTSISLLG